MSQSFLDEVKSGIHLLNKSGEFSIHIENTCYSQFYEQEILSGILYYLHVRISNMCLR